MPRILLTGACGFAGSSIAKSLLEMRSNFEIIGLDNFIRPGSEINRRGLTKLGVKLIHGDVRMTSDLASLPAIDWVIDAAANPSVLAGVDGQVSSRQVVEHNLTSTINLLEYAREHGAGFILLSTSRVYSIASLARLPLVAKEQRFHLRDDAPLPDGVTTGGLSESFSVAAPLSLYGATKLASEILSLEYAETLGMPVWINRCGVMAGAGQFGRADQGIVAFWINSYLHRRPLRYLGFEGRGLQVRDAIHPRDISALLVRQLENSTAAGRSRVVNVGGGHNNSFSLAELSMWCEKRFGFQQKIDAEPNERQLDIPWLIMDSALVEKTWHWQATIGLSEIFEEVARHAEAHPDWLELSAPY